MCDSHKNGGKKGDEDMIKTVSIENPTSRKSHISKALREVELINSGKLSSKRARCFLKESRNK